MRHIEMVAEVGGSAADVHKTGQFRVKNAQEHGKLHMEKQIGGILGNVIMLVTW